MRATGRGTLALGLVVGLSACGDSAPSDAGSSDTGLGTTAASDETATGPSGSTADTTGVADSTDTSGSTDTGGAPLLPVPEAPAYAWLDRAVTLDGSASTGAVLYQWNFDDGTRPAEPSASPQASVAYTEAGRYHPTLTVWDDAGMSLSASVTVTVTAIPTHAPRYASTVVGLPDDEHFAVVSPDSDEVAVVVGIGGAFGVQERRPTCDTPRTVTALDDGRVAVACEGADAVMIWPVIGGEPDTVPLPYGSAPYGIISLEGRLWVTLPALGEVAQIDPTTAPPQVVVQYPAIGDARGIAALPDGRLAVTRWRSPDHEGQLVLLDPADGSRESLALAYDPTPPSDTESGGVPSYLDQVLVSPQADVLVLPSLQANIGQGEHLDGLPLTFESTLRGIASFFEPGRGAEPSWVEDEPRRKHFDNRGLMSAGVFSSRGDYLFVAGRGTRAVERVDMFNGAGAGVLLDVGYAPSGLALTPDDHYLLVDAYLSRELVVYDVSDFSVLPTPVATLAIPSAEPLSPTELRGKQLFNDSYDPRIAKHGYLACAHCHLDGQTDRRTWDFTDRGEGVRNTIDLRGRAGVGDGPLHWSANFDEVHDFEHDIRGAGQGTGLIDRRDFVGAVTEPLGDPKAGLSADLDALDVYVSSLDAAPRSPFREPDGSLGPDALAGQALFETQGCTECHSGERRTDSGFIGPGQPRLHDVGTITEASGQRLGEPLLGLDTPSLVGAWATPPYLHRGQAPTLRDVLVAENPGDAHGVTSDLSDAQLDQLVAYLLAL